MDALKAAPLLIKALAQTAPADALPPENSVTRKGNPSTRLVKRIILARLNQAGHLPHRYTGDKYNFQFGVEQSRFNFRVSADAGRDRWWSNTSLNELASLTVDDAVMLLIWHPPGSKRWLQQLVVFAVAPQELDAGIHAHEEAILHSCVRSALQRASRYDDRIPGLSAKLQAGLQLENLNGASPPAGAAGGWRDRTTEIIAEYREQRPPDLNDDAWAEARKQAQKTREMLSAILIQIFPHPNIAEAFRVVHQSSNSVLAEIPPQRVTTLQLGELERQQLRAAYNMEGADVAAPTHSDAEDAKDMAPATPTDDPDAPVAPPIEQDPVDLTVDYLRGQLVGMPLEQIAAQIWGAIAAGKHVVLTGVPGTAKTTIALAVATIATETDRCSTFLFTTATTDWTAMDTVGGYVPHPKGRGLVFRPGKFLECFRDPASEEQDFRWLVIDELNRAEVDKAFGQFFTVLSGHPCELPFKRNKRRVVVVPDGWDGDGEGLYEAAGSYVYRVPRNWRMLATLNTDDKASLFEMSFAFLRRFAFVHVPLPTPDGLEMIRKAVVRDRIGLTDERSIQLGSLWNAITSVRPLGPALLIDMAQYLRSAGATIEQRWDAAVGEAIAMFVVPQLEGLNPAELRRFRQAVLREAAGYWTLSLEEASVAFLPAMKDALIASGRGGMDLGDGAEEEE